ncbi:hypothetical protein TBC1_1233 [Lentimicrobium saccharophilum]|uniref:Uncharacterized protein n=1 Tax=Lentimicrobium saccharophilum TaxID=1678841 RepID=A0A0S7C546_9BACT|nr:hypothetical protein TBC1_1233 [Lentimicrobium saccharophilum]
MWKYENAIILSFWWFLLCSIVAIVVIFSLQGLWHASEDASREKEDLASRKKTCQVGSLIVEAGPCGEV